MDKMKTLQKANEMRLASVGEPSGVQIGLRGFQFRRCLVAVVLVLLGATVGCESDGDCLNCFELPPPVVPTGVHSISANNEVIVQWFDIAYSPYDDRYNENVTSYIIYARNYDFGDENNPGRTFEPIAEVAWDENYDSSTGLHWFSDFGVINGRQYEYAVAAVNANGLESALSFEFVADAPLPMSPLNNQGWFIPVKVYNVGGPNAQLSGFDFRLAGLNPNLFTAGVVDPQDGYDIQISFEGADAYALANGARTRIQDFGVFSDGAGHVLFEGVSWAPADGYSRTGKLELIAGHIYLVEIIDPITQELHYAKFGVDRVNVDTVNSVDIIWAYQLIPGLPELAVPDPSEEEIAQPQLLKL